MKKNDFILIVSIMMIAASVFGLRLLKRPKEHAKIVVSVKGDIYGVYDLDKDQVIDINGSNTLVIKNGAADMTRADCPHKLCVYQRSVSKEGESIVCLPNKIIVTVEGTDEPLIDASSK